jgi:inner membrane protein
MTERTHDLFGLTALTLAFIYMTPSQMSVVTLVLVVIVNQIGSAFPDLDQPTAEFYQELPAGSIFGRLLSPLLGSHRLLSHSFLGLAIFSYLLHLLLNYLNTIILVDMSLIWWSFVLGYLSHLIADSFTKVGVPWFFPIPIRLGFPPIKWLRITTGKFMEKVVLYPALFAFNSYLIYANYNKVVEFFSTRIIH